MIDPRDFSVIKEEIAARLHKDRLVLDDLRREIRPLRGQVKRIHPRTSASLSLVAADGGNNQVQFDPFLSKIIWPLIPVPTNIASKQ